MSEIDKIGIMIVSGVGWTLFVMAIFFRVICNKLDKIIKKFEENNE